MYHSTWHAFHLIMCFLTGFIWVPIWVWRTLSNSQKNKEMLFKKQMQEK